MNPNEVLRIVDAIHRDKHIDKEIVFLSIESALVTAVRKHYGEDTDVRIQIDRANGIVTGYVDGVELDPEEIGRIGAQAAKQVIIQKIREAERDALFDEYEELVDQMVTGVIHRVENDKGIATVTLDNIEGLLPRSETIIGETHRPGERVQALIFEVRKKGSRVKVLLSRTRPKFVQRLFEQEIPEIAEGIITIEAIAREPGHRSKVAVQSSDQRIDCVGACVGVRGNRIKNVVDELGGERIDIVRWSSDPLELITNALSPAEVEEVILCQMMGRAIVLVREDQLSLAIGRRGQNVRLGSKLCGWDIEIMTREELEEQIERAVTGFCSIEGLTDEVADMLVGEGYLSYDDLSVIEPDELMKMGELTEEQVDAIVTIAEERAEEAEAAVADARRDKKDKKSASPAEKSAPAKEAAPPEPQETPSEESPSASPPEAVEGSEIVEPPETSAEATPAEATPAEAETGSDAPDEEKPAGES